MLTPAELENYPVDDYWFICDMFDDGLKPIYLYPDLPREYLELIYSAFKSGHTKEFDEYVEPNDAYGLIYTEDQLEQILLGLQSGVDVSCYDGEHRHAQEMQEIREYLEQLKEGKTLSDWGQAWLDAHKNK